MGILRADRIAGLGGANAITGSVNFTNDGATSTGDYLRVDRKDNSDFNLSTNDFTIEFWMYSRNVGSSLHLVTFAASTVSASSDAGFYVRQYGGVVQGYLFEGNNSIGAVATGAISTDRWYHIAYVRSGSTFTMYLDGTSTATATSSEAANFNAGWNLNIGSAYTDVYHYNGYISNLRIINGTALYTGNFTVPNTRLTNVSNTVLLACQSSGNVLQEGTNKNIHLVRSSNDNTTPQATHFTPNSPVGFSTITDVGSQYGSTFDGVTTFDSQAYFVPPGGNTRERNRGRAVIGWANNPVNTGMDVFNIQSMGNATAFGNLTSGNRWGSHAFSSTTRGLWAGGYVNTPASTFFNTIEFVTIASNGNPTDFADTSSQNYRSGCCSSSTKGIIALGFIAPNFSIVNTIDQVTMATAGNATNFGDLFQTRANMASASSPTRGFFAGGVTPANQGTIDFITIASEADAQDFGDLQEAVNSPMALASSTRGIIGGGYPAPTNTNVINFITIASTGDALDFGDLTGLYSVGSAVSNNTRGVFTGGYTAPSRYNLMEFVTISTTGNASDFGDMTYARRDFGACSDSHGGLE